MYARVASWEGADADAIRATVDQIKADAESGPPPGVPAKGLLFLMDPEGGRTTVISLFESEADRAQGHETLEGMSPPGDGMGRRTGVEMYEVGIDLRM
jgi:hypothetical protein